MSKLFNNISAYPRPCSGCAFAHARNNGIWADDLATVNAIIEVPQRRAGKRGKEERETEKFLHASDGMKFISGGLEERRVQETRKSSPEVFAKSFRTVCSVFARFRKVNVCADS